jgi:23S rRNA (guanine745-N1)-methyltransferase
MSQLLCAVRECHQPLNWERRRVICPRGHSYDIARSGYVNLLQPQERRARAPGDNPEAVAARRRFLDRGFAAPLLQAVRECVAGESILDAGCGEGYYLGSIGRGCGIDISTAAIDLAARRYPQCQWVVANADRLVPYADASFDVVMSITGRMNPAEFRRVLKSGGRLLIAVAAPDDLRELHRGPGRDRAPRTIEMFSDHFEFAERRRATTQADLDRDAVRDLLAATYRPREAEGADVGRASARPGPASARPTFASPVTLSLDLLTFTPRPAP